MILDRKQLAVYSVVIVGILIIFSLTMGLIEAMKNPRLVWQPVSGVVQYTGSAMVRGSEWTIIKLDDGRLYTCTDPRCVLLEPSERVSLSCYRTSQEAASSSWMCRFVSSEDTVVYPTTDR